MTKKKTLTKSKKPKVSLMDRQLEKALKLFPKIVERDRRRGEHQKKMMKAFAPMSRALLKAEKKK